MVFSHFRGSVVEVAEVGGPLVVWAGARDGVGLRARSGNRQRRQRNGLECEVVLPPKRKLPLLMRAGIP